MVRYGLAQSPVTPRRWNSADWMSTHFWAKARHSARKSSTGTWSLSLPFWRYCSSIFHSIGKPWQSQPWDIGRGFAQHALAADHNVLQDLVQRMADMDVAVGIRRPVMQDELLPPLGRGRDLPRTGRYPPSAPKSPAPWSARPPRMGNGVWGQEDCVFISRSWLFKCHSRRLSVRRWDRVKRGSRLIRTRPGSTTEKMSGPNHRARMSNPPIGARAPCGFVTWKTEQDHAAYRQRMSECAMRCDGGARKILISEKAHSGCARINLFRLGPAVRHQPMMNSPEIWCHV